MTSYYYENSFDLKNPLKWKIVLTQRYPPQGSLEYTLRTDVLENNILKIRLEAHDHGLIINLPL